MSLYLHSHPSWHPSVCFAWPHFISSPLFISCEHCRLILDASAAFSFSSARVFYIDVDLSPTALFVLLLHIYCLLDSESCDAPRSGAPVILVYLCTPHVMSNCVFLEITLEACVH